MEPIRSLDSVGEESFRLLAQDCAASNGGVNDLILLSLAHIYGKNFNTAVEVVDEQRIVCFVGEKTQRSVVKVQGKSASDVYLVFPKHFCSCQAFFFKVVHENEAICCKHQLAARLALALGRCPIITISDVEIASMLAFGS
ncbi:hypothetical protein DUNSADRAFT_15237 [Dunaliella salina]|uniref:SWIM-type domain-containing protein n=1 Tax=Dunaliella salina TaxID=3046 RepID=A0ABQ7H1Y6_DUNSA|nr:hypothetical protein DUNSADRAFT_15237 [Dunaliella salina]|eukprot:KAF5840869.1 hypothetical protein DUNSADRAFT_15237 [Dunaliella salina]